MFTLKLAVFVVILSIGGLVIITPFDKINTALFHHQFTAEENGIQSYTPMMDISRVFGGDHH